MHSLDNLYIPLALCLNIISMTNHSYVICLTEKIRYEMAAEYHDDKQSAC